MQAVILAAGEGTRLWPLTSTRPKPLLKVLDRTVLEHNLEQLASLVEEVILVVGYKGEMIRNFIGNHYKGLKISYAWQKSLLGTGDAVKVAEPFLKDKFLVLNGDDFYFKEDLTECLENFPSILVKEVEDPRAFAAVLVEDGLVKDIIEKPKEIYSNLANIGVYFLDRSIFKIKLGKSPRGEYEITDFVRDFAKNKKLYFRIAKQWFPGSYPWHLLEVNEFLLKNRERKIEGEIEENCQIIGPVIIQEGTIIKKGTYIKGPVFVGKNCQIGPNSYLRDFTSIGDNCIVGQGVEIKSSIISDFSSIPHLSYIGDSIIGENCNLGAGTITANLRFDGKTIKVTIRGERIDTKRKKFGCVLGNNTKTGINVSLMPGVLIGSNSIIYPKTVIFKNIKDNTIFKGE